MTRRRRWQRDAHDREILRLAVPAFGALVAEPLYVLVDTAIVGHLGTPELAGLGVASSLVLTGYALFVFLAYGTTGTVARLIGAGARDRAAAQGVQALWLALGIGAALAIGGLVTADLLVDAMGARAEAARHAATYFRISMAGVPALTLTLAGTGYLRGLQDTRTPLVVAVTTAAGNLLLEVWFVLGLDWGIPGSAWSTVIVQWLGAAAYIRVVVRDVRANRVVVRPDRNALMALSRVNIDLLLRTAALRVALVVATAVATRLGTTEVAAHQVVFDIWSLLTLVHDSIAIAAQAIIGRLLGSGDADGSRHAARRMVEWGVGSGLVATVLLLAVRTAVPDLFTDDPAVIALATFLLVHVAVLQPVNAAVFVLDGVLIGAGDLRYLAKAMAVAAAVFVPAAVLVAAFDSGIGWLWAAIGLLQVARLTTLARRVRTPDWLVTGLPQAPSRPRT